MKMIGRINEKTQGSFIYAKLIYQLKDKSNLVTTYHIKIDDY